jgi:hypothetical protein
MHACGCSMWRGMRHASVLGGWSSFPSLVINADCILRKSLSVPLSHQVFASKESSFK